MARSTARQSSHSGDAPSRLPGGRVLHVLEALATSGRSLTVAELGQAIGVSRPQAHRIVATLEKGGVLARHPRSGRVIFGLRLTRAVLRIAGLSPLPPLWRPVLQSVVDEVGETCNLLTFPAAVPTYLDRVEARWPLSVRLPIGSRVPLHCTASGKLYLGCLPPVPRRRLIDALPLPTLTPHTLTTPEALVAALDASRDQDVGLDQEEFIAGMVAIAVPVRGTGGEFLAALAVHAPTVRHSVQSLLTLLPTLRAAASAIAALIEVEPEPGSDPAPA